ncbi:hypothetical protein TGAM01_v206652 [Trichoderma gamsii]|uniref:Uncharacterized protein n=1 Tax=Trichoderma gamsii TaxID=398673 RepID=A0A2P4ZJ44_9HYPO|nr:hypothetical protein TGAM01_v206652 [Trichoderma gamsii]PON24320.1 hypothetical protein TGAM01_v206652 [Trichoderma gamsii]
MSSFVTIPFVQPVIAATSRSSGPTTSLHRAHSSLA